MTRAARAGSLLAAFVLLSLTTRGLLLGVDIIDMDEAAHIVGSWELLRGRLLYTDFADNKPPLVYVYYAAAQLLLGRGMLAVRLLTTLVTVPLTAYAASAFFRHDRRGLTAGLLYLVYGAAFLGHDMLAVNCELLMLLPATWALVLVRDEADAEKPLRWAAAGFLLGVASLFKQQAAFWLPALAVAFVFASPARSRRGARAAALGALGAGFALPLLVTGLLFAWQGGAPGLLYWTVAHNFLYAANPILATEALERAAGKLLPFLLATAALWWGWRRSMPLLASRYQRLLVSGLVVLSLPPAFIGLRFFPHYFIQLYVPLALAAAPGFAEQLTRPLRGTGKAIAAYSLFVLLGFTVANGVLYLGRSAVYEETSPVFERVAERLHADRCFAGATLFVWGYAPIFYYYADLPVASRFVVPQSSLTGYVPGNTGSVAGDVATRGLIREEHWDWLMGDLERSRCTYILDTAPAALHRWQGYPLRDFPRLFDIVRERYERVGAVDRVDIYRRRGCPGPSHTRLDTGAFPREDGE